MQETNLILFLTASLVVIAAPLFGSTSAAAGQVSASLSGVAALAAFVLTFGYYIVLEGQLGQALSKMLLGIKVVREDTGEVPGIKVQVRDPGRPGAELRGERRVACRGEGHLHRQCGRGAR